MHFCIYELSHPRKDSEVCHSRFVDDFGEEYAAADELCKTMNNFRKPGEDVRFCVRRLDDNEFAAKHHYNPIIKSIIIQS